MSFSKRSSEILDRAKERSEGVASISPTLDLGNGVTLSAFDTKIADADKYLKRYNEVLSTADAARYDFEVRENALEEMYVNILKAVAVKFGEDSVEYEKAGGTPKSKRKHPFHKPKAA